MRRHSGGNTPDLPLYPVITFGLNPTPSLQLYRQYKARDETEFDFQILKVGWVSR